jgi:cytoskeletal protein RodZ
MSNGTEASTKTIGPILQEARTAKGLTIEAAAAASKVPLSYARLMEQEQFHLVPDPLYLIRFLTEYATFLGLNPKQVEAQLKEQVNSARVSEPSHPVSSTGSQIDLRRLLIYLLPAAAVIPLIFIGLSLFSGSPPTQTTPLPSAETAAPPTEGLPAAPPSLQTTAPQAQAPQSPPSRYRLQAEAQEMTWLAVSADGAPRREVLLRAGETAQWSANNRFTVTIGNPRGVALSLNGRPISLKGEPGQVIRDLALPGDGEPPLARQ